MRRVKDRNEPKVIVVEDDKVFVLFWERMLKDIGVTNYFITPNPLVAKKELQRSECVLLISDVILPKMNGYELARYANEKQPGCRVILTTAFGTDLSRFNLTSLKFHLLHKPYTSLFELKKFLKHVIVGDESFDDISEDSFSENEDYPQVTEWKL